MVLFCHISKRGFGLQLSLVKVQLECGQNQHTLLENLVKIWLLGCSQNHYKIAFVSSPKSVSVVDVISNSRENLYFAMRDFCQHSHRSVSVMEMKSSGNTTL